MEYVTLYNGVRMPMVGYGVYQVTPQECERCVLDAQGKIDPDKLEPIAFDPIHNTYRKLGEKVGNAFRDGAALK